MKKIIRICGFVSMPVILAGAIVAAGLIGGSVYKFNAKSQPTSEIRKDLLAQVADIAGSTSEISADPDAAIKAALQEQINLLMEQLKALQDQLALQQASGTEQESFSYTWDRDLYYGLRNDEDVRGLQNALTLEGVYKGPVTGDFLSLTRQAVIDFQKKHNFINIPGTGYAGPHTIKALNDLYSKPAILQDGQG